MGAIKSYYHDEICEDKEEPGQEEQYPTEEQWWEEQNKNKQWIAGHEDEQE